MNEYYVSGFLTIDQQVALVLKARKIGYSLSISEYGAGTVLTFEKIQEVTA